MKLHSMKLHSMKLAPREKSAPEVMYPTTAAHEPTHPYGLRLYLEEEQIKALGLAALPKPGTVVTLQAKADVCSRSESESMEGEAKVQRSLTLQITDLAVE